jgi:hypothetical protein
MDETLILLNRMGEELAKAGNSAAAEQCFDKARELHERLQPVRESALDNEPLSSDDIGRQVSAG